MHIVRCTWSNRKRRMENLPFEILCFWTWESMRNKNGKMSKNHNNMKPFQICHPCGSIENNLWRKTKKMFFMRTHIEGINQQSFISSHFIKLYDLNNLKFPSQFFFFFPLWNLLYLVLIVPEIFFFSSSPIYQLNWHAIEVEMEIPINFKWNLILWILQLYMLQCCQCI